MATSTPSKSHMGFRKPQAQRSLTNGQDSSVRPTMLASAGSTTPMVQSSPWILSGWRDLVLFIGTPLLIWPLFTVAQLRWSAQDIYLFVGAFGAMGHHLPGMMRAYGDRNLFERFKVRFVVAPIALVAVCAFRGLSLHVWNGLGKMRGQPEREPLPEQRPAAAVVQSGTSLAGRP